MTGPGWPELAYNDWKDTCATLHLWTQIVGKIRLACTPWTNHSWHVTQYVTARGLTTSAIPHGRRTFEIDFDFIDHVLRIAASDGGRANVELRPRSVSDFHRTLMTELDRLGLPVRIHGSPNEVVEAIPFERDDVHRSYDPEYAQRFWQVLASTARVLTEFRAGFIGKCSPVHFFWGSFDLAVTRFSGRPAPEHPGGVPNLPDRVTREAYSHEVSSAGFWPGAETYPRAIFYSYAYPSPPGFADSAVRPEQARWEAELSEFVLPYDAVRTADSPERELMAFFQSTYQAAAELAGWDRARLEPAAPLP
ncbi:MAG: DUF5996 family protein [Longimicrobiales bacterium]